jgi:hypothetical protein
LSAEQRRRLALKGKTLTAEERRACCQIVRPETIGRTTVANMLTQAGIEPAPERNRKRTRKQFLKSHWETLYACDFFGVEVVGMFGTVRHMVFFVIEVKSRAVQIAGIRIAPDGDWMKRLRGVCSIRRTDSYAMRAT